MRSRISALLVACFATSGAFAAEDVALTLPPGFTATLIHEGVGAARHIAVRDNGDVYVITRRRPFGGPVAPNEARGIVALRDTTGDGYLDMERTFEDISGTGIGFHHGMLYASSHNAIYRFMFLGDQLVPTAAREVVVSGFPEQGAHAEKPFTFDAANGHLYVNVGSPSNACLQQNTPGARAPDPCPELERQSGIWRFQAMRLGQTQQRDGLRYGAGLRNTIALAWNARVGELYAVVHGRDQLDTLYPDLFDARADAQLPAEEMFIVEEGREHGWPYTYWDPLANRRVLAPEYGGDGQRTVSRNAYPEPIVAFPAHAAPNGLVFYHADQFPARYRGGAFVAFHGSSARGGLPAPGYHVAFVPLREDGLPAGPWEVFADGFAGGDVSAISEAAARPMGLTIGPDGSMYVTDSQLGRIWRIRHDGS